MELSRITFLPRHTRLRVHFRHHLYSAQVPGLASRLLQSKPALANHQCQNRQGRTFVDELEDTELGHVFEHLILALLAERQIYTEGHTNWNWHRDPIGTYHVTISCGERRLVKEAALIAQAILTNHLVSPAVSVEPTAELALLKPAEAAASAG